MRANSPGAMRLGCLATSLALALAAVGMLPACSEEAASPPPVEWSSMLALSAGEPALTAVSQGGDGSFLAGGTLNAWDTSSSIAWLVHLGQDGTPGWQVTLAGASSIVRSIVKGPDGGYVVAVTGMVGYDSYGYMRCCGEDCMDSCYSDVVDTLFALDKSGKQLWAAALPQDPNVTDRRVTAVLPLDGGGFVLLGTDGGWEDMGQVIWLARLDEKGTFHWLRKLGQDYAVPASPLGLAPLADGGFLVAGDPAYYYGEGPVWLAGTDSEGSLLWSRTDPGKSLSLQSACPSSDGGIVVAARPYLDFCEGPAVLLMKFDAQGEEVWSAAWDDCSAGSGRGSAYLKAAAWLGDAVVALPDGGYAVAGGGGGYLYGPSGGPAFVAAFDEDGSSTWSDTYGDVTHASAMAPTADEGLVVAGWYGGEPWVLKLGP